MTTLITVLGAAPALLLLVPFAIRTQHRGGHRRPSFEPVRVAVVRLLLAGGMFGARLIPHWRAA